MSDMINHESVKTDRTGYVEARSVLLAILFTFITFGIYGIYWMYRIVKSTKAIRGDFSKCTREMLGILFLPGYCAFWWFTRGKYLRREFSENGHAFFGNGPLFLILAILGHNIVLMALTQASFNRTSDPTDSSVLANSAAQVKLVLLRIVVYAILVFLSAMCLFFFYLMVVNASRSNAELQKGFTLIPSGNFFTNLKNAWTDSSINIPRGMLNSLIIALSTAVLTTYFSALTAYGVHVYDFKGKKFVFTFIMAIMMIPAQVSALGFVQMMNKLNLDNNFIPLIIPGIAAPVVFFYMKQYMESVLPLEVIDAARVDGSSEFRTFNTIVLPMLKPALAVQMIFSFVSSWNNFFIPALLIDKPNLKTVPIMIAQLRSADYSKFDMGKVYMFILLAILPVLITYIILSKSIIKGVTAGSVKG